MLVFLDLNGKWLNAKLDDFYELSVRVSASRPSEFDDMVASIKGFLRSHIVDK
jgi:prophage maintenance system killer protein